MTDRTHVLTVVLERDFRTDDVEHLIEAIKCLKGVADVTPQVTTLPDYEHRARIAFAVRGKLIEAVCDILDPKKPL